MPGTSAVTLRSRWVAAHFALAVVSLVAGAVLLAEGQVGVALVIAIYLLGQGVWGVARIPFWRVVASPAGVNVHGVLRNHSYAWQSIAAVRVDEAGDVVAMKWWAPALVLVDGTAVTLMQLAGPATSAARGYATRLASLRPRDG